MGRGAYKPKNADILERLLMGLAPPPSRATPPRDQTTALSEVAPISSLSSVAIRRLSSRVAAQLAPVHEQMDWGDSGMITHWYHRLVDWSPDRIWRCHVCRGYKKTHVSLSPIGTSQSPPCLCRRRMVVFTTLQQIQVFHPP